MEGEPMSNVPFNIDYNYQQRHNAIEGKTTQIEHIDEVVGPVTTRRPKTRFNLKNNKVLPHIKDKGRNEWNQETSCFATGNNKLPPVINKQQQQYDLDIQSLQSFGQID